MSINFFDFRERITQTPRTGTGAAAPRATGTASSSAGRGTTPGGEPLTVSQLTSQIDRAIKQNMPPSVLVKGELSNCRPNASSGHLYFTLKDDASCINCVMFRSEFSRLKFTPKDGMEMLAAGRVQVYAQQGKYQLYTVSLQPLGVGALEVAFRQLHAKLQAEGLFDRERKRPLPHFPSHVAIVTSRQAAALQDMLKVLRRFPWVRVSVYHVPVQGDGSAERIADALRHLNRFRDRLEIDVILLGRGGGSLEDLWEFNEECVVRAIVASHVPVVTGIGHEVDTSIADLVADHHAHTPTEAAQVVTAQWRTAPDVIDASKLRLRRGLAQALQHARQRLLGVERHEAFRTPLFRIHGLQQRLDDKERSLALALNRRLGALHRQVQALEAKLESRGPAAQLAAMRRRVEAAQERLSRAGQTRLRRGAQRLASLELELGQRHPRHAVQLAAQRLERLAERLRCEVQACVKKQRMTVEMTERHLIAIGPEQVLRRGYSITPRKKDGAIVRSASQSKPGDTLVTRLSDGQIESTAEDANKPKLFE